MNSAGVGDFVHVNFELLQYVAFFGTLALLGAAELFIPQKAGESSRLSRWPANFMLTALNIVTLSLIPVSGLVAADWAAGRDWTLFALLGLGSTLALAAGMLARSYRTIERVLGWVVVTPGMHRIHHSTRPRETDSNYGATLSLWDRLFGTFRFKSDEELTAMRLGLAECQDGRSRSLAWLLKLPFIRLLALDASSRQ